MFVYVCLRVAQVVGSAFHRGSGKLGWGICKSILIFKLAKESKWVIVFRHEHI